MKLTAIVVDDEKQARAALIDKLDVHCPYIEILYQGGIPELAIKKIRSHKPDILFLDIGMPEMDGFTMLRHLPDFSAEVIFVTAYDQYAIEAFKVYALGYLLKPIDTALLISTVDNVRSRMMSGNSNIGFQDRISQLLRTEGAKQNKIAVPVANGYSFVPIRKIVRCEAAAKYTIIHYDSNQLISTKNIGYFVDILTPYGFFPTHKSHLVNLEFVQSYTVDGEIVLTDGSRIPLSRRRKTEFMKQFR